MRRRESRLCCADWRHQFDDDIRGTETPFSRRRFAVTFRNCLLCRPLTENSSVSSITGIQVAARIAGRLQGPGTDMARAAVNRDGRTAHGTLPIRSGKQCIHRRFRYVSQDEDQQDSPRTHEVADREPLEEKRRTASLLSLLSLLPLFVVERDDEA